MAHIEYPDPPLGDGAITLRPLTDEDVEQVTAACQDPLIARYTLVPSPYGEDDARAWFREAERQRREAVGLHLLIVAAQAGELLGSIGVNTITWVHRVGQVGYWVAPDARQRGVAVRAVRLLSHWLLTDLGLGRVEIRVDVENEPSQLVAEKAGFTREGVLRSRAESKGRRWDEVMFSLLPGDLGNDSN